MSLNFPINGHDFTSLNIKWGGSVGEGKTTITGNNLI